MSRRVQFGFTLDVARSLRAQTDVRIRDLRKLISEHQKGEGSCMAEELRNLEEAMRTMSLILDNQKDAVAA